MYHIVKCRTRNKNTVLKASTATDWSVEPIMRMMDRKRCHTEQRNVDSERREAKEPSGRTATGEDSERRGGGNVERCVFDEGD